MKKSWSSGNTMGTCLPTTFAVFELTWIMLFSNYEITSTGPCRRVGAVACMKYMDRNDWRSIMDSNSNEYVDTQKTAEIISGWINAYLKECVTSIESLETNIAAGRDERRNARVSMILNRWKQIKSLCEGALDAVAWEDTDTEWWLGYMTAFLDMLERYTLFIWTLKGICMMQCRIYEFCWCSRYLLCISMNLFLRISALFILMRYVIMVHECETPAAA